MHIRRTGSMRIALLGGAKQTRPNGRRTEPEDPLVRRVVRRVGQLGRIAGLFAIHAAPCSDGLSSALGVVVDFMFCIVFFQRKSPSPMSERTERLGLLVDARGTFDLRRQIQLSAFAIISDAPVVAQSPCAIRSRSGLQSSTLLRAARAGSRDRKLRRQSPGVLPRCPTM